MNSSRQLKECRLTFVQRVQIEVGHEERRDQWRVSDEVFRCTEIISAKYEAAGNPRQSCKSMTWQDGQI